MQSEYNLLFANDIRIVIIISPIGENYWSTLQARENISAVILTG